ncbi:MAG: hypothetical protein QGI41_10030, partial [Acidimicrobiales bacterium]|nr:hypothetical protein [Acidimicrobiales bacterium]
IADAAGGAAGAASGDLGDVEIDGDAPDLSSVADTTGDGAYGVGEAISITVTWDEAVVTSNGALTLSNGQSAAYTSGTGNAALVFTYTVAEGNTDSGDLKVTAYTGTIADAAGGAAAATGTVDLGSVTVDGDAPDLSSVAANDATYKIGDAIAITVTWDEAVVVSGTPTLTLDNGATASYTSGTGNAALVFTYTVADGDTDTSNLQISSYSGTIADAAGGAAAAVTGDLGTVVVDASSPDITGCDATDGAYGVAEAISITCTYNEAVTVTGTPTITLSNGDVASYASGTTSTSIVFTTTVAQGDTDSADLSVSSIQPTAGGATMKDANANAVSTVITGGDLGDVTVDGAVPVFSTCTATDGDYGVGDVLTITCTWGEAVVTSNGALTLDNGDSAAYSSGSGSVTLTFTTTIAEGDGSDSDVAVTAYTGTIADAAGGAAGAASGDLGDVEIDGDAP